MYVKKKKEKKKEEIKDALYIARYKNKHSQLGVTPWRLPNFLFGGDGPVMDPRQERVVHNLHSGQKL